MIDQLPFVSSFDMVSLSGAERNIPSTTHVSSMLSHQETQSSLASPGTTESTSISDAMIKGEGGRRKEGCVSCESVEGGLSLGSIDLLRLHRQQQCLKELGNDV